MMIGEFSMKKMGMHCEKIMRTRVYLLIFRDIDDIIYESSW